MQSREGTEGGVERRLEFGFAGSVSIGSVPVAGDGFAGSVLIGSVPVVGDGFTEWVGLFGRWLRDGTGIGLTKRSFLAGGCRAMGLRCGKIGGCRAFGLYMAANRGCGSVVCDSGRR